MRNNSVCCQFNPDFSPGLGRSGLFLCLGATQEIRTRKALPSTVAVNVCTAGSLRKYLETTVRLRVRFTVHLFFIAVWEPPTSLFRAHLFLMQKAAGGFALSPEPLECMLCPQPHELTLLIPRCKTSTVLLVPNGVSERKGYLAPGPWQ